VRDIMQHIIDEIRLYRHEKVARSDFEGSSKLMTRRPLLRCNWVTPAAALLLSLAFPSELIVTGANAEGETPQAVPSVGSPAPATEKKSEEEKQPAAEAAKPSATDTSASDSKPAEAKDAHADGKPSDAPSKDASPAETNSAVKAPEPKEVKPEAKAEAKPEDTKPSEPKQADTKPADAKPADPNKDAKAEAKPKDLLPRLENSPEFAVRASTVNATYRINWLGAYIGDFKIHSSITNRQYSLQANANVSVFFGTVSWQGVTSSRGLMTANGPVPQNYTFRYAANEKREAIELRFQQRMVQDIIINPPQHPGGRNVPITAAHLQNVIDPLSAIVLLSQARLTRGDACSKRLPIFDGKTRYDLVLSSKGTRSIGGAGKLRGTAYVCSVRYVPIAGHRPGKQGENDYATGNTGIEVWLVPLPEAGLLVPYYVHVPTPAGTASMVTASFDVDTPSGRHALAE
jgi:hypothetical protein